MKTLKYEEVHRQEYRDLAEARTSMGRFIEKVYKPAAAALGARLPATRRVRAGLAGTEPRRSGRISQRAIAGWPHRFGRKQRCPLQGNPASDRIPQGPGCNRHSRVCTDASIHTGLPRRFHSDGHRIAFSEA
jgi:hypothetical protein